MTETINETTPTMSLFKEYSKQLDEKHDRYERIVHLSRDITIESKRIIFLLHRITTDSYIKLPFFYIIKHEKIISFFFILVTTNAIKPYRTLSND